MFKYDRYSLQSIARKMLINYKNPRGGDYRVTTCQRVCVSSDIVVLKSEQYKSYYGNLATCGSVWTCPVCASKITERRKEEINEMLEFHKEAGGSLIMMTLTFSHNKKDKLKKLIGNSKTRDYGFTAALQKFRYSRAYRNIMKKIGYVGLIRSIEVTYGKNGWHPHSHEVLLLDGQMPIQKVLEHLRSTDFFRAWRNACYKSKLALPNQKNGLNFQIALSPSDYLAKFGYDQKWGVGNELTKQHLKRGNQSLTPFDFLRCSNEDFHYFKNLFREYSTAFFGKSQIFYTRGLRKIFGLKNYTDQELIENYSENAVILFRIQKAHWAKLLKLDFDIRNDILIAADKGDFEFYKTYLN